MLALAELEREVLTCTRCPLAKGRTQAVFGVGDPNADLMFVGEAPGQEEDLRGEPFVGRSGRLLDRLIAEELGLTRERVYITNTVRCRPPGNRDPQPDEVAACRAHLDRHVDIVDPRVIVTLGNFAARVLLATTAGVGTLRGRSYPFAGGSRTIVPTYHPSYVLRSGGVGAAMAAMRADLVRAKEHLAVPA